MKNLPSRWYLALAALAVAGAVAVGALLRPLRNVAYTVTPIGEGLGGGSYAVDINARGDVLGRADGVKGGRISFVQKGNRIVWLPAHAPALWAQRLNNGGAVIGRLGRDDAFVWRGGVLTTLAIGDGGTAVFDINNQGQIVGNAYDTVSGLHPFVWRDGKVRLLPGTPAANANDSITAINDAGAMAGFTGRKGPRRIVMNATIWENGHARRLPMPPGTLYGSADAINERGEAAGSYRAAGPNRVGFVSDGRTTDLGPMGGDVSPSAINNRGEVVGTAEVRGPLRYGGRLRLDFWRAFRFEWPRHAFLWRNGRIMDLNDLIPHRSGWELEEANAINDAGQIVGTGTYNGQKRGFLLTPVTRP
jgi:probable HAF family extracellular repeat protein